jgi:hypothetical protein
MGNVRPSAKIKGRRLEERKRYMELREGLAPSEDFE